MLHILGDRKLEISLQTKLIRKSPNSSPDSILRKCQLVPGFELGPLVQIANSLSLTPPPQPKAKKAIEIL